MKPLEVAEAALDRARRAGASEVEAFITTFRTSTIEVRDGVVETLIGAETRGIGLRVLLEEALGFASTTDLTPAGLEEVAAQACRLARQATPDPAYVLAEPQPLPSRPLDIYDPALAEVSPQTKIDFLRDAERQARASDARVRATHLARYVDGLGTVALANSRGVAVEYRQSSAQAVLVLMAGQDDEQQLGAAYTFGRGLSALSAEQLSRDAVRRAVASLGGQPLPTGRFAVVMEPEVAAEVLAHLGQALSGEAAGKGRSLFAGRLGQALGSRLLTLIDEGNRPGGLATAPIDGEGVPTQRTVLFDQGILRGFLHNLTSARRMGVASTGNGTRQSFRQLPEVGPSNLWLEAGEQTREQLVSGVERGFYVVTTRHVGGINPVSGDYSVGAAGLAIEHGELTRPVARVTLAGTLLEMLQHLSAKADDLRWVPGAAAIGSPTIRIDHMTVAGT